MVLTIKNETDFNVISLQPAILSGRYEDPPTRIDPFQSIVFTGCERNHSFACGFTGGQAFYIQLDDEKAFYLSVVRLLNPSDFSDPLTS